MDYAIVLVDSRPQLNLDLVLADHLRFLPGWHAAVFSSARNRYVRHWGAEFHEIPEDAANTWAGHSQFMSSPFIWERLADFERVMTVQQDSKLLRTGVGEFLEWDYVGAPWVGEWIEAWIADGRMPQRVGNGGLSLRNPRACLEVTRRFPYGSDEMSRLRERLTWVLEDVYFCANLGRVGARISPDDVGSRFACEGTFTLGTLGCHAIHRQLTPEHVERVLAQYQLGNPAAAVASCEGVAS
jgi:hypothetical protein